MKKRSVTKKEREKERGAKVRKKEGKKEGNENVYKNYKRFVKNRDKIYTKQNRFITKKETLKKSV